MHAGWMLQIGLDKAVKRDSPSHEDMLPHTEELHADSPRTSSCGYYHSPDH